MCILCLCGFHNVLELLLFLSLAQEVVEKEAGAATRGKLRLICFMVLCNMPPPHPAICVLVLAASQGEEEARPEGQPRYLARLAAVEQPRHCCTTVHTSSPAAKAFAQAAAFPNEPCTQLGGGCIPAPGQGMRWIGPPCTGWRHGHGPFRTSVPGTFPGVWHCLL